MTIKTQDSQIVKRLIDAGIMPPECVRFDLHMEAGQVIRITTEHYLSAEHFKILADLMLENASEAKAFARSVIFINREAPADKLRINNL